MKRLCFFALLALLLASCDQVIFPEPQPPRVDPLSEFPAGLRGVFLDEDGDTLTVGTRSFSYDNDGIAGMQGVHLSDSAVIKAYNDRYFFNTRIVLGGTDYWLTYIIRTYNGGANLDVYAMNPDEVVNLAKLQEITSKVRDIEDDGSTYYLFDPKRKHYKKIISDTVFSKMISFRRIQSMD